MKRLENIITALVLAAVAAVVVAAGFDNVVRNKCIALGVGQQVVGVVLLVLAFAAGLLKDNN